MDEDVEVTRDNTREVESAISKALAAALEEVGLVAEGAAKRLCRVDTGRLRNSITHQVAPAEGAVYVGTNVEYSSRVLVYGGDVGFDFGGCEVVGYANPVTERMGHGR